MACLWKEPGTVDTSTGINTAVRRLRAVLDDDAVSPKYIETVVGLGYRFVAEVNLISRPENPQAQAPPYAQELSGPTNTMSLPVHASPKEEDSAAEEVHGLPVWMDTDHSAVISSATAHQIHWKTLFAIVIVAMFLSGLGYWKSVKFTRFRHVEPESVTKDLHFAQITLNDSDNRITSEAISHDGKLMAFGDNSGISVRILGSGVERLLLSPIGLRTIRIDWFPGNGELLVSGIQSKTGASEIWVISLQSEVPRLILQDAANAVISPGGPFVAFTRHQASEMWLAGRGGEAPRKLLGGEGEQTFPFLLWTKNGSRLLYLKCSLKAPLQETSRQYHCDLESLDPRGSNVILLQPDVKLDSGFFGDDRRFYYSQNDFVEDHPQSTLVVVTINPRTGRLLSGPQLVYRFPADSAFGLSASDDGKVLGAVLRRRSTGIYVSDVRSAKVEIHDVRRLAHPAPDNYPHAWTPDGSAVIFESDPLSGYSIYKQKLDGSPAELLARSAGNAVLPQVTPDGKWILFENFTPPPRHADTIFRIPLNGGRPEVVPVHGAVDELQCSLSSKGVCVLRREILGELVYFFLDPITGEGKELGRTQWVENALGDWSVSPDGTSIALPIRDQARTGIRLARLSLSPTPPIDIQVSGYGTVIETTWAPNSQGFFVETKNESGYSLLYVDLQGNAWPLRTSAVTIWGVPSRDGSKLAFVGQTTNSNVWIGIG